MMQIQNSSKMFLMAGLLGGELPFPIYGGFGYIDNVAKLHLRVAKVWTELGRTKMFVLLRKSNTRQSSILLRPYIERLWKRDVWSAEEENRALSTFLVEYDSSDTQAILGELKLESFENAIADVAGQYLPRAAQEKGVEDLEFPRLGYMEVSNYMVLGTDLNVDSGQLTSAPIRRQTSVLYPGPVQHCWAGQERLS